MNKITESDINEAGSNLNAIAIIESRLDYKHKAIYGDYLADAVDVYDDYYHGITFSEASKLIFATAEQRVTALRRTLKF